MSRKVLVKVIAEHRTDGTVLPLKFEWDDGCWYEIDRLLDVKQRASMKVGGQGLCYKCRIQGKEALLFNDQFDGVWFMEGK